MNPTSRDLLTRVCEPWQREGIEPPAYCDALSDAAAVELAARAMLGTTLELAAAADIEVNARAIAGLPLVEAAR
jgi:hypothetical protein